MQVYSTIHFLSSSVFRFAVYTISQVASRLSVALHDGLLSIFFNSIHKELDMNDHHCNIQKGCSCTKYIIFSSNRRQHNRDDDHCNTGWGLTAYLFFRSNRRKHNRIDHLCSTGWGLMRRRLVPIDLLPCQQGTGRSTLQSSCLHDEKKMIYDKD